MTLKIHTEEDEQRQLQMTIEVPEERVQTEMKKIARKLARDINVPGFRRGKAPYSVIVSRVGKEYLRSEAIEAVIQPVYEEALDEVNPDIYAQATLEDIEDEPLKLSFTVPLAPQVDLGDYRSLRKEIEPVEVTDEAVEEALQNVQSRYQELEEVDRPAEAGDLVTIAGKGVVHTAVSEEKAEEAEEADAASESEESEEAADSPSEETLFDTENLQIILDSEKVFPGTLFVDNIIGMSVGEEKSFSFTFPEDFEEEELQGKEASFDISLLQVQNRLLPEIDDHLAESEGYESLEALREHLREDLQKAAEDQARNALMDEMVQDMREIATMVYPPAAVKEELDNRIEQFKRQVEQAEWQWDDYLKIQGTTEEQLRQDFEEAAVNAVESQLILRQFVLDEKLTIDEGDVDAKIDERIQAFSDNEELSAGMRDYYKQGYGLEMISSEILTDKAYQRMVDILSGNAPDLAELEAEEEEESEAAAVEEEETAVVEEEETAAAANEELDEETAAAEEE